MVAGAIVAAVAVAGVGYVFLRPGGQPMPSRVLSDEELLENLGDNPEQRQVTDEELQALNEGLGEGTEKRNLTDEQKQKLFDSL